MKRPIENLKLNPVKVELSEIQIKQNINDEKKRKFNNIIKKVGIELVENKGGIPIEKIKMCLGL